MTTVPLPETPNHIEAVRALLADIRSVRDRITGFVHDRRAERRRLNLNASVSDGFFEAAAIALEGSEPLAGAVPTRPAELRDVIGFSQAYASLAEELELTARGLRYTIALRRASMAQLAMQVYAIGKGLNRPADGALLVPYINSMKRSLKRRRRPAPEAPAEPPPPDVASIAGVS